MVLSNNFVTLQIKLRKTMRLSQNHIFIRLFEWLKSIK